MARVKRPRRLSMAERTQNSTSTEEEQQLDLATLHERLLKCESSQQEMNKVQKELGDHQKEMSNCMGRMEERLREAQSNINRIIEGLAETRQQMNSMMGVMNSMMEGNRPEDVEASNSSSSNPDKDGGNKSRKEQESRRTNLQNCNDASRHGK